MKIPFKFSESKQTFTGGFGETQFVSGPPGKSAYEIAVLDGFVGTEEEWLESLKGEPGKPGENGKDGVEWIDLGEVEDVMAEMDNLLEDGHYRLWTDDPFCYSLTVERCGDTVGQTHWSTEEGCGHLYFRTGRFYDGEFEWYEEWTSHVTQDWLNQYALKTHKHRQNMNANFDSWIQTFRDGQYQINVQDESKSYIVDQFVFNNKPISTIHVCQRYFEMSEPWKVYARHGTTNGNYVLVNWGEWQVTDYGAAMSSNYIITGTWYEDGGEKVTAIDDTFSWDDMVAAIRANRYVGCVLRHADDPDDNDHIYLTLGGAHDSSGYVVFAALGENNYVFEMYIDHEGSTQSRKYQLATKDYVDRVVANMIAAQSS